MRHRLARSCTRRLVVTTTLLYMRNREQSETSETRPGLVALQAARNRERASRVRERGIGLPFPQIRLGAEVQRTNQRRDGHAPAIVELDDLRQTRDGFRVAAARGLDTRLHLQDD